MLLDGGGSGTVNGFVGKLLDGSAGGKLVCFGETPVVGGSGETLSFGGGGGKMCGFVSILLDVRLGGLDGICVDGGGGGGAPS